MYNHYFNLQRDAFALTPDPGCLFSTMDHQEALAGLVYAITRCKGFVVLTGDAGTGKTTLLRRALQSCPAPEYALSLVLNPMLTPREFLEMVLIGFGITEVPESKTQRLVKLQKFLVDGYQMKRKAVLIVDEAQRLPADVLEEIRLLSNFERADAKYLQIVLAGQTELASVLNREDLRQLKQRIAVRLALRPLYTSEVKRYIEYRWQKAGGSLPTPFRDDALEFVIQYSRGIPRLVNTICDNALLLAYGEGGRMIGPQHVMEVARDLDLLLVAGKNGNGAAVPVSAAKESPAPAAPQSAESEARGLATLDRYSRQAALKPAKTSWLAKLGLVSQKA